MQYQSVILFDGVCNFCNSTVTFVIKRDRESVFKFAALQTDAAKILLERQERVGGNLSSIVLVEHEKVFTRSTAILRICRHLPGMWPGLYGFLIVPKFIRDSVYNWIAKNRYKWFGKKNSCMIPSPEIKARFLSESI